MPQDDFFEAVQPLFDAHLVDVIEWSMEMGWGSQPLPSWCQDVLSVYGECDRLLGHGVHYSLLSANRDSSQWLADLAKDARQYRYRHITEHFGWMVAGEFIQGAPLPMAMNSATVRMGQDRLRQLANVAKVPVGLENLAFSFHRQDVLAQGSFLTQLLKPIDGFILLDLHNLFCQMHNFQLSAEEILSTYPLEKVRELHLSGGSWSDIEAQTVRRDTHDQEIPEAVFQLFETVLDWCPNLDYVIVERLGNTLVTPVEQQQFQAQFRRIHEIVETHVESSDPAGPDSNEHLCICLEDTDMTIEDVENFQASVLSALYGADEMTGATVALQSQGLNPALLEYLGQAKPEMLQLAQNLIKKWGKLSESNVL